jgi:beta-galactosidase/evolved beta-galactosidase subunit alpha
VHTLRFWCDTLRVEDAPDAVTITAEGKTLPYSHYWGFATVLSYRVTAGGRVDVGVRMDPYGSPPAILPRVGVVFELPAEYTRCSWLGRGPDENYPDCKAHTPVGLYSADVTGMNFAYDVPQETGSRGDCRRVTVSGGGKALEVTGNFAFSFHDFTQEALTQARHCDELEKSENKYLYIDYKRRGLGSHSCGPEPEEEYELKTEAFRWGFTLVPVERER